MVVILDFCKYGLGPTKEHGFRIKGLNTKCDLSDNHRHKNCIPDTFLISDRSHLIEPSKQKTEVG